MRRQDGFFTQGVVGLRPLNLKTVADAIGMHELTVSRVTSNKYIGTPRGLFEMKYFFSTSIASNGVGEAHSAESVRFKIKQMIDAEDPRDVLSDDVIVARLKVADIVIARRTVAKYRDSPAHSLLGRPAAREDGADDRRNVAERFDKYLIYLSYAELVDRLLTVLIDIVATGS